MPIMGPACYVQVKNGLSGVTGVLPIAPLMLFLGETEADEPDTAARDAACDLGQRLERPVLLLDLAARADTQHASFAAAGLLAPRAALMPAPSGQAVLQFHPVRASSLYISTLYPPQAAADEGFWQDQIDHWPTLRRRLLELFGAVVVAAPGIRRSPRALSLAGKVEATILALRDGQDVAARGSSLRERVVRAGGRTVGVVLTGCDPHAMERRAGGQHW